MLTSIALILIVAIVFSSICEKIKLPRLLGMILTGILLGPYMLNLISPSLIGISADLRQFALIIILIRAGLNLNLADFKEVGRPALLLCFVPAVFEISMVLVMAPLLFDFTILESLILGSVLAAVSPAVIVPKMLQHIKENKGTKEKIPQMIMAAASLDDVFVIVVFSVVTTWQSIQGVIFTGFLNIPVSIILGVLFGVVAGIVMSFIYKHFKMRDTIKVLMLLSCGFVLTAIENLLKPYVALSSLVAIIVAALIINKKQHTQSKRLSEKFAKLWVFAEIMLFVLIGACLDLSSLSQSGLKAVVLILVCLASRVIGVLVCVIKTKLTFKHRLFCAVSYLPKATVQAAIGAVPLSMGFACGNTVLTIAVTSILLTAPVGALLIDIVSSKVFKQN